jgi:hypothetical protein
MPDCFLYTKIELICIWNVEILIIYDSFNFLLLCSDAFSYVSMQYQIYHFFYYTIFCSLKIECLMLFSRNCF